MYRKSVRSIIVYFSNTNALYYRLVKQYHAMPLQRSSKSGVSNCQAKVQAISFHKLQQSLNKCKILPLKVKHLNMFAYLAYIFGLRYVPFPFQDTSSST